MSLVVATYWWTPDTEKFYAFNADDVRLLARQVKRHLPVPHEFVCITDQPDLFDGDPDIRAIWLDRTTHVHNCCYARLMTFHPNGAELIGERVLQIDLDTVIVGDMTSLVERKENLVLWHNPGRVPWHKPIGRGVNRPYYNTSLLLHRCGTLPKVWTDFDPGNPSAKDDQWYLADIFGPVAPYYDRTDGVYRLARREQPETGVWGSLPANARLVTFPGSNGKPWQPEIRAANPWIDEHVRPLVAELGSDNWLGRRQEAS